MGQWDQCHELGCQAASAPQRLSFKERQIDGFQQVRVSVLNSFLGAHTPCMTSPRLAAGLT